MNKVEAFKNELRNYRYYKDTYREYVRINGELEEGMDDMERYELLKDISPNLQTIEQKLDGTFTQLTGFHAIRYDAEPSSMNESLTMEVKLDLIEQYNFLLKKFHFNMDIAERNLSNEIVRLERQIGYIDEILGKLPKDIKDACFDIYCNRESYDIVAKRNNHSSSGFHWKVNKEISKALDNFESIR